MSVVHETCDVPIELRIQANIFVKGLPDDLDSQGLHSLFSSFGEILSAKVVQSKDGKSLGYGYIQYATADCASRAVAAGTKALGREGLSVHRFVPKNERDKRRPGFTNIYVRNFPKSVACEGDLMALFRCFGEVNSVFLAKDDDESTLKGFGFVNFVSHDAAMKAVQSMNDKKIGKRNLYVAPAQTKEERARILAGWVEAENQPKGEPPLSGETIIVKNLPYSTSGKDLRGLFESFGKIYMTKIAVMNDGKSRGFGFVHFEVLDSAHKAIEKMHLTKVGGRRISVTLAARKGPLHTTISPATAVAPLSPLKPTSPVSSLPTRPLSGLPAFQYQQMCYPAYQYPIPSQSMQAGMPLQSSFVSAAIGYMSNPSPEDMTSSPNVRLSLSAEERTKMLQHGMSGSWNQPYYWPPSTGSSRYTNVVGHMASNPYGMMGHVMHAMQ